MSVIGRSPVAIVQECHREGCEFCGGIARVECVEDGHSVGIDYVRASTTQGAVDRVAELDAAVIDAWEHLADGDTDAAVRVLEAAKPQGGKQPDG